MDLVITVAIRGSLGSYLGSSGHSKNMSEMIGNTARDAVVGGTISVIGGGKFANGAQTQTYSLNVLMNQGKSQVNLIRNQHQNYRPFCLARYRLLIHEWLRFS
jgi:hypothetical protein